MPSQVTAIRSRAAVALVGLTFQENQRSAPIFNVEQDCVGRLCTSSIPGGRDSVARGFAAGFQPVLRTWTLTSKGRPEVIIRGRVEGLTTSLGCRGPGVEIRMLST